MIPLRLRLRNFMCYRSNVPPLLLDGVHVACLCGENGAGKSALLDAMTWALWGQTSRGKNEDDLISQGRDEMEVELEFQVATTRYRVVRKKDRGSVRRPGGTVLELQMHGGTDFVPITANKTRETQDKLNTILRMDYTTFVNSSFLVQGRADEFTTKTPDKRKEVLGKILDLDYYEDLKKRSETELRRCRDMVVGLEIGIRDLERELARREEYQAAVAQAETLIEEKSKALLASQEALDRLRSAKQELDRKQAQSLEARQHLAEAEEQLGRLRSRLAEATKEVATLQGLAAQGETISAQYTRFQMASARKEMLDGKLRASLQLTEEAAPLERAIAAARAGLESSVKVAESTLKQVGTKAVLRAPATIQLANSEKELEGLRASEVRAETLRSAISALGEKASAVQAANQSLRSEMDEIKAQIDLLKKGDGACPLCGTPLSEDRCKDVLSGYERRGKECADVYRRNTGRLAEIRALQTISQQDLVGIEGRLKSGLSPLNVKIGSLRAAIEQGDDAQKQAPAIQGELQELKNALALNAYAKSEQQALGANRESVRQLGYSKAEHDKVLGEHLALRPSEERHRRLEEAARRLPIEEERLKDTTSDIAAKEGLAAQEKGALAALAKELVGLPQAARELQERELSHKTLAAKVDELRELRGAALADLRRLQQVEGSLGEKRAARKTAVDEQGVYEDLVRAFGRSGVQALIIDSALPEIEQEANRLLARMTDNRMHVKLETQAAYRSREGVQETLEIKVSDEIGTRAYETFSGGEAFRINVALRIALSRLLAKRAGAPLPTLFIDEGFGTQDAGGRDKVVETITSIQDEFERILIITHIDELKEQFPVRVEVTKTADGSTFALV